MSLVGRVRINTNVSQQVVKTFRQFPAMMDRIEIFDNSIANDPSPPCKAAAIIHRSRLTIGNEKSVPCVLVLKQKVYDYNNRAFQAVQLQSLVDSVATKYLGEHGGGVQLTVHSSDTGRVLWHPNAWSNKDVESYSKSREVGEHRNNVCYGLSLFRFPFMKFSVPVMKKAELPNKSGITIDGLTVRGPTYMSHSGEILLTVLEVDSLRRKLSCVLSLCGSKQQTTREEVSPLVSYVMREMYCMQASVVSNCIADGEFSGSLVVNHRAVNFASDIPPIPLYSEFIM